MRRGSDSTAPRLSLRSRVESFGPGPGVVSSRHRIPRWTSIGAAVTGAALLTACSSSSSTPSAPTTTAPTQATASVSASATTAPSTLFGAGCEALGLTASSTALAANLPVGTVAGLTPFLKNTVAAATAAGLTATLNAAPAITVFAPTDDAFKKEPAGQLQKLLTTPALKPQLIATLQYGVVPSKLAKAQLVGTHVTQQGQKITITGSGDSFVLNGQAKILCGGLQTKNAVVYIVDTVLHPAA